MRSRRQTIFCGEPLISGTIGNQVLGRISHSFETPRCGPLEGWGGRGATGSPHSSGKVPSIWHPPPHHRFIQQMCAFLEACGTWGRKLVESLTARDSEVWRQRSFLTCKAEKSHSAWNGEKKESKKMKKMLLRSQQQASGCENRRPALHGREGAVGERQVPGQWAHLVLPEVF